MSRLEMTLQDVQALLGEGTIHGNADFLCRRVASIAAAGPEDLSFVKDERYVEAGRTSRAGALLVPMRIDGIGTNQLVVSEPFQAFGRVLHAVADMKRRRVPGVDPGAHVHATAAIADDATVGPGAVVCEDARVGRGSQVAAGAFVGRRSSVGEDSTVHPNAVIMEDVHIGDRVTIHGGAVIGADGYGYIQHEGRHIKVPQVGDVIIGDDVEIGALVTIDRATVDATVIGRGTKIGDLCHVAHNCQIGEDVLLLPTVAISGSCTIGRGVVFAGRAGCSDNLTIGEGAVLGATAVAFEDVDPGAQLWGNPARPMMTEKRLQVLLTRLPEMARDVRALKKERKP